MPKGNYCVHCYAELRPRVCQSCQGTGEIKWGIFSWRDCKHCDATGKIMWCPNMDCTSNSLSKLIEYFGAGSTPQQKTLKQEGLGAKPQVDDEGAKIEWWLQKYWRRGR